MGKKGWNNVWIFLVSFLTLFLLMNFYLPIGSSFFERISAPEKISLVSENFDRLIFIEDANHLDNQGNLIGNLHDEVSERDNVWSNKISGGESIRVKFEEPLDKFKDITIYARSFGESGVEVYEKGGSEIIAEFEGIFDGSKKKVFLEGLEGLQNTFDLKVIGGPIEFDFIVDPASLNGTGSTNNAQLNFTITEVNTSKTFLLGQHKNSLDTLPSKLWFTPVLENGTTISFTRYSAGNTTELKYKTIESSNLTVQRGVESVSNGTYEVNVTLNSVNLTETFVMVSGRCNSTDDNLHHDGFFSATLPESTRLFLKRSSSENDCDALVSWQVIEYAGAEVQSGSESFGSGETVILDAISEVNLTESFLVFNWRASGSDPTLGSNMISGNFSNSSGVSFQRHADNGGANNRVVSWYVVSISNANVQTGGGTPATSTSNLDKSISPVNGSKSFVLNSHYDTGAGRQYDDQEAFVYLLNSTTVRIEKANGDRVSVINWQVIELPDENDIDAPALSFVSPTETNASTITRSNIVVNITASDINPLSILEVKLFNSSRIEINSSNSTSSPLFINFTGLADGLYYFNATANDSIGNLNSSETREVTIDTTVTSSPTTTPSPESDGQSSNSPWSRTHVEREKTVNDEGGVQITLRLRERIRINVSGQNHHVGLEDMTETSAIISIASSPVNETFLIGESKFFELNGDEYYDLKVTLDSIEGNLVNVTMISVNVLIGGLDNQIFEKMKSVGRLIEENPICLELEVSIEDAQTLLDSGDSDGAVSLLKSLEEECISISSSEGSILDFSLEKLSIKNFGAKTQFFILFILILFLILVKLKFGKDKKSKRNSSMKKGKK